MHTKTIIYFHNNNNFIIIIFILFFKIFLNFLFFLIKVSTKLKGLVNSWYFMIVFSVWNEYFICLDFGIKHTNMKSINLLFIYLFSYYSIPNFLN